MAQNDGKIILSTKVDTKGIKASAKDMENAANKAGQAFGNLGTTLAKALSEGDTKTAQLANNYQKATDEVAKQIEKVDELKLHLAQLKSGEVSVDDKGVLKLQADFDKTSASIEKTKAEINELYMQLDQLQANAFKAPGTGEIVFTESEKKQFDSMNAKLDELEPKLAKNKEKAAELGKALQNAVGTATQAEIDKTKAKLSEAERKLGNLSAKAEIAGQKLETEMNKSQNAVSQVSNGFGRMGTKLLQLAKGALVFSAITKGFTSLRENTTLALMSNEQFRQSVYQLQAALWVVSEPIYQAILPSLQIMIKWLTVGMLYIATFFSALGGKTLKQAIASAKALNKQAQAYDNISKSSAKSSANTKKASKTMKDLAKQTGEANKELADFDELMILQKKSIDEISAPSATGSPITVESGGIQNGFSDLESLLNDNDMQNLDKFQIWVLNNKDAIKTALEIAGLGALGLGIGKVISKIGNLLGWFSKKDNALDTQTGKTQKETASVNDMANAFSFAISPAKSLSGALSGASASALEFIPQLDGVTSAAFGLVPSFGMATDSALGLTPTINEIERALQGADVAMNAMEEQTVTSTPVIENSISGAFNNASQNIATFSESKSAIYEWCDNVRSNIRSATNCLATNIYEAFDSAVNNITNFVNDTSSSVAEWCKNVANNSATSASRFANNWGEAIKSAWNNFKSFMSATGEKISGVWNEHKAEIITIGTMAGLAITGIALAPYTGGASLALPALAKGGVVSYSTIAEIGENGKEAVLPLENNTEWMDTLAVKLASRMGGAGQTTVILEVDGREFGRAVVKHGKQENRRVGTNLVFG